MSNHPRRGISESLLSHERLLEAIHYDPETGVFTAMVARSTLRIGQQLGDVGKSGYRRICLDRRRYLAGRLAWFYVHAKWPTHDIDHRDLSNDNNRLANLREATQSQNNAHRRRPRGTLAPLKGAHWNRFRNYWQSYIGVDGRRIFLGRFKTPEEAHAAYVAAAHKFFGEFGRAA